MRAQLFDMRPVLLSVSLLIALLSVQLAAAHAGDGSGQSSIGYRAVDASDARMHEVVARHQRRLWRFIGAEAQISYGVTGEEISGVEVSSKLGVGGFATASYPMTKIPYVPVPFVHERSTVFVRGGYSAMDVEAAVSGLAVSQEINGAAFGVGAIFMVSSGHGVRFDYLRVEGDASTASSYGISYTAVY